MAAIAPRDAQAQEAVVKQMLSQMQKPDVSALLGADRATKERMLAARLEQLARQARAGSLAAHARLLHRDDKGRPLVTARHHAIMAYYLERPEEFPFICFVEPPGYAKSTWCSWAYPAHRIGLTKGNVRIGLVANTHTLARAWSSAVQTTVESETFRQTYGVRPDYDRAWRDVEWAVEGTPAGPNYTFTAMGMNGPVQSRRFDEIIIDDPTTAQQAISETALNKQKQWFQNTLMMRLPPGTRPPEGTGSRIVVVLTRWSARDIVPLLKRLNFHVVHMPALGYWDGTLDDKGKFVPGVDPLWAEQESAEQLETLRETMGSVMFELVMQGNTDVLSGDFFMTDRLTYDECPPREQMDRVVMGVDTSSGKDRKKGDYFAAVTLGLKESRVHVMRVFRDILTSPRQVEQVKDECARMRPDLLVIEDVNEGTALYQTLVSQHIGQAMKAVVPTKDKEWRARAFATAVENRLVNIASVSDGHDVLPADWAVPFVTEMEAFPDGENDDQVDAAAHAYNEMGSLPPRMRST